MLNRVTIFSVADQFKIDISKYGYYTLKVRNGYYTVLLPLTI